MEKLQSYLDISPEQFRDYLARALIQSCPQLQEEDISYITIDLFLGNTNFPDYIIDVIHAKKEFLFSSDTEEMPIQ